MIIDFHTHIFPEKIASRAISGMQAVSHAAAFCDGTLAGLQASMKNAGVAYSVVLPVATNPAKLTSMNDAAIALNGKDGIFHFGAVHPLAENWKQELDRIAAAGLKGIKIHPDSQGFSIDDPRLYPMYEIIRGRVPIMLHMGDKRYNYSHPIKLRKILDMFPGLDAIAAHFGGYSMYDTALELLKDTNCVMDVSSSLMFMGEGKAEYYVNQYGAERLAFGTDYPMWDPILETRRFFDLKLTESQFEQIAHKTAERILRL